MSFWKLSRPDYRSDYQDSYINGSLQHPFGMPGVVCDVCGATWGGGKPIPYECPKSLQNEKNLNSRWPIPRDQHAALQQRVFSELGMKGEPFVDLRPGSDFQPAYLDVPSRPQTDFLWPFCGAFLASERIKDLLADVCGDEIIACPVVLRKIGKRRARLPAPIPQSGEPEDIMSEVPVLDDATGIGPYYQMIPRNESGYPLDCLPKSICTGCKRVDREVIYPWEEGRLRMTDSIWRGHKIFYLGVCRA
jgi:hypothetical protein